MTPVVWLCRHWNQSYFHVTPPAITMLLSLSIVSLLDLPIKEDTPGERDITCADTSQLRELGWIPTIDILD